MLVECPNVAGSPNLKRVTLDNCESLSEVDSSIFLLQKLERLCISKCTSLKSLSGNTCSPVLGELNALDCTNLQEFSVTFASIDRLALGLSKWVGNELPSSILHTKNLKTFVFPMIECLVDLPENFADCIWLLSPLNPEHNPLITLHEVLSSPAFMSVKHLNLSNIPNLSEFPDNIFLPKLESLILIDMVIRSFPETIMHLPRLNWLRVYNCKMLQSIPALSQFLPFSIVSNCESLEEVLISSIFEQYHKPNHGFTVLLNCEKLNPHSYHTVLKYAIDGMEHGARLNSENEDGIIGYFLPAMPDIEYWSHYTSTQVSFTLELPPNLLGFAYYLVLSQGHMGHGVDFGCECYMNNSLGERIYITSFARRNFFEFNWNYIENSIHMMSDHVVLWYDSVSCKQIMEEMKAINDVNSTSYNPKLTFRFFIDETLHDETSYNEVEIKECGFRWIYQEEASCSTVFESHDEEETIRPRKKLKQDIFGNSTSQELDVT
jgi:hypothetical protein